MIITYMKEFTEQGVTKAHVIGYEYRYANSDIVVRGQHVDQGEMYKHHLNFVTADIKRIKSYREQMNVRTQKEYN